MPEGGMGAVSEAIGKAARGFGATIRVGAPVAKVLVRDGRTTGVVLGNDEEIEAPLVVTTCHPQITFLRQIDRKDLPAEFVADIENYRSRSGREVRVRSRATRRLRHAPTSVPGGATGNWQGHAETLGHVDHYGADHRRGDPASCSGLRHSMGEGTYRDSRVQHLGLRASRYEGRSATRPDVLYRRVRCRALDELFDGRVGAIR
jgi:hypothetical protein